MKNKPKRLPQRTVMHQTIRNWSQKDLQVELAPIKVMLGVVMGGIIALLMRAFF